VVVYSFLFLYLRWVGAGGKECDAAAAAAGSTLSAFLGRPFGIQG